MQIDDYGRVTVDASEVFELIYKGHDLSDLLVTPGAEAEQYNARCVAKGRVGHLLRIPEPMNHSPEEEHAKRARTWRVTTDFADLDVWAYVLSLCEEGEQTDRVSMELELFDRHGLMPILRLMAMLVAHFRAENIVCGVGRGSSVASYVLFKMGVHHIDSLKYGLDIKEFLR